MLQSLVLLIILGFSSFSWADDLIVSKLKLRPALKQGYPTTVYLNIENFSDQVDYLIGVEILGFPEASTSINKTVVEKNVARIIQINQLAIPPKSIIKLSPFGIYIIVNELFEQQALKFKFIFKHHDAIISNDCCQALEETKQIKINEAVA